MVGPAKRLLRVSTKAENVVPTAATLTFPPCQIHKPTARALQVGVREIFCALRALDTTKYSVVREEPLLLKLLNGRTESNTFTSRVLMSTSNFDASASNFCQPPRQKKLRHPARIEPLPASIKFHVILAHERVTQDPKRFTNISECV